MTETKEGDISDISLKHITRGAEFGNTEPLASLIDNHWTVERLEKAAKSAPKWLVYRWAIGQTPKQIARETGHELKDILRMLKGFQKSITSETETHSAGNESGDSGFVLADK